MGQFSAEKPVLPGSALSGNQQVHIDFGARDIPAPLHGARGGEHAHAMGGMLARSIAGPSNRPGMARG